MPGGLPSYLGRPADLLAGAALFGLAGLYYAFEALRAFPDAVELFFDALGGDLGGGAAGAEVRAVAVYVAAGYALVLFTTGALLAVALLLWLRRRVGRGLAWAVTAWLVLSAVLGANLGTGEVRFALLASMLASAILVFGPAGRVLLDAAPHPAGRSTALATAQLALLGCTVLFGLWSLISLARTTSETKYLLVGLLEAMVAAGAAVYAMRLPRAEHTVRLFASGALVVLLAALVSIGGEFEELAGPIAAVLATTAMLWLTPDLRRLFGQEEIDWRGLLDGAGRNADAAAVPSAPPSPPSAMPPPSMPPPPAPPAPPPMPAPPDR
ncbi:MAG: hypothetical protein ACT4QF_22470 [Sporichthyaceae bacterium]